MAEKENKFTGFLNEKILPKVGKFANTRFVRAVMGAGYSIIAFTIVGSMFLILSVLTQVITFPSFVDFYNSTLGRFNNLLPLSTTQRWGLSPSSSRDLLLITTRKFINKKKNLIFHR